MNSLNRCDDDDLATLDPPGTIAVVGAGAIGIEAALYGRFLGYDVTLIEAHAIGHSIIDMADAPLPMLPHRCLSTLALGALAAQNPESVGQSLPLTIGQWLEEALVPLTETDLLRDRLLMPWHVSEISTVPLEPEQDPSEQESDSIPPDFQLKLVAPDGEVRTLVSEAVILASGPHSSIKLSFSMPTPYFFQIVGEPSEDWEQDLHTGHHAIVEAYAQLAGRQDLDLYRPKRI